MPISVDIVLLDELHFCSFVVVLRNTENILLLFRCSDFLVREMRCEVRVLAVFFHCKQNTENGDGALGLPTGAAVLWLLVDQPVEFAGVLAGDLVHDIGREAGELLLDVFRGFRPHPVGVRVV